MSDRDVGHGGGRKGAVWTVVVGGGSGQRFDWSLAVALAEQRDLIVAGGLAPDNVAEAVRVLHPYGVDVASGVEAPGNPRKKDEAKLRAFVAAVRAAEAAP